MNWFARPLLLHTSVITTNVGALKFYPSNTELLQVGSLSQHWHVEGMHFQSSLPQPECKGNMAMRRYIPLAPVLPLLPVVLYAIPSTQQWVSQCNLTSKETLEVVEHVLGLTAWGWQVTFKTKYSELVNMLI